MDCASVFLACSVLLFSFGGYVVVSHAFLVCFAVQKSDGHFVLYLSHNVGTVYGAATYGRLLGDLWVTYGRPMGDLWVTYGGPMGDLWVRDGKGRGNA